MTVRAQNEETALLMLIEALSAVGEGAPSEEEKLVLLRRFRGRSEQADMQSDRFIIRHISRYRQAINTLQSGQEELQAALKKLAAFPWYPAIFLQPEDTPEGPRALVLHGSAMRLVSLAEGIELESLARGDSVFLSHELNVILATTDHPIGRFGDTAIFGRLTSDGRAVLKFRDEEILAELAASLDPGDLKTGDLVRWNREAGMAFEKIERSKGDNLFLEATPSETFADVGGLGAQIEQMKRLIILHLHHAETVSRYGLRRKGSVLLEGPVGTGKTLLARALANFVGQLSPANRCLFMHIKPGALNNMWFGQTEANYREIFRVAREAAAENPGVPVVIFFDEVDAIGTARGGLGTHDGGGRVDDRVQTALMSELDGLESRGNILVVAATNRRDVLDPALVRPGRLADLVIQVPRPNMRSAADIFAKHLKADIPFARNGHGADLLATRQEIINSAVSQAYSPNADNALATILFRDGKQRIIRAADLINGATIANIARAAIETACVREIETGESGLRLEDVLSAMAGELETAARMLSPWNCHRHLTGLPQDVAVASVTPVVRKVSRPHRYLHLSRED